MSTSTEQATQRVERFVDEYAVDSPDVELIEWLNLESGEHVPLLLADLRALTEAANKATFFMSVEVQTSKKFRVLWSKLGDMCIEGSVPQVAVNNITSAQAIYRNLTELSASEDGPVTLEVWSEDLAKWVALDIK